MGGKIKFGKAIIKMSQHSNIKLLLLILIFFLAGCNAYKYGYTERKALNAYYLVTGNENNFGDKRIKYNKSFHRCECFTDFLESKGSPAFIYEYYTNAKCKGIKLFYPAIDSVFVFEEAKKNKRYSFIKESRKMDEAERVTYQRLKVAKGE